MNHKHTLTALEVAQGMNKVRHWKYDWPWECQSIADWFLCGWDTGWRVMGVQYDHVRTL